MKHFYIFQLCLKRILICLLLSSVYPKAYCVIQKTDLPPSLNNTYIFNGGSAYTYSSSSIKVGYDQYDFLTYRKGLRFDLSSINQNYTITDATLFFSSGNQIGFQDGTIRVNRLQEDFPGMTWSEVYNVIDDNFILGVSITVQQQYTASLLSIISEINAAHTSSTKRFALGIYNQYEGSAYGTDFQQVYLRVSYLVPTPGKVLNLQANSTTGSCSLTWDVPTGTPTSYDIFKDGELLMSTSTNSAQICNLSPGSSMNFTVRATNADGPGPFSDPLPVNILTSCIYGPSLLCASENYSVSNLPTGSTITWSCSSNMTISDIHSNPCTVSKYSNGPGTLEASISSSCINYSLSMPIHTGPYSSSNYPINGPSSVQCSTNVYYSIPPLAGVTSINWVYPSSWTYISGQNSQNLTLRTGQSGSGGSVMVGVDNTCGHSGSYSSKYTNVYGTCTYNLIVTPNPASDEIKIEIPEEQLITESIDDQTGDITQNYSTTEEPHSYRVTIIDDYGKSYVNVEKYSKTFTLPVQHLKNGNYFITIIEGSHIYSSALIINHK
jgi:hypothetical protein